MEPDLPTAATLIRSRTDRGVCTITLDSPQNRNALSTALADQLLAAVQAAGADEAVRVVVLSHAGPVFSAGADLAETAAALASGGLPVARLGDVLVSLAECPKPVVARVAGPVRGGGIGLVAAADIAVCASTATFAFSEVRLGVVPAVISAIVLPRLAPRAAAELMLTGETFTGERAAEVGLVTASVMETALEETVDRYVASLLRCGPSALAATKRLLGSADLATRLAELTALSVTHFTSAEGREGMAAFAARRDPAWVPVGP
jgi:methylglutaconyl-CoA hydratase